MSTPNPTGKTYAVTGANRGLGLEFVRQLSSTPSAHSSNTIIAAVRSLASPDLTSLRALASSNTSSKIHILECDTSSPSSIAAFGSRVTALLHSSSDPDTQPQQLHYLINNAGINSVPHQTALTLSPSDLHSHIDTNVLGPAKLVEALAPHLQRDSVVMNMTSGLGSCGKGVVKCTAYSISKAALNMLSVHQAGGELGDRGVKVICMDPGWVKTRMGGEGAVLEPEESIAGMLKVVHGLEGQDLGGKAKFYTYDGSEVPW